LGHALTIAQTVALAAQLRFLIRDHANLAMSSRGAEEYCRRNNIVYFGAICRLHRMWTDARRAGGNVRVDAFRGELATYESFNGLEAGYFRVMLAELLLVAGDVKTAATETREAIDRMVGSGEKWWLPEARRVLGDAVSAMPGQSNDDAEASYLEAIAEAGSAGNKLLQLRAASSLAHLRRARSDRDWSRGLIDVYAQFPPGEEGTDLRAAASLLKTASASRTTSSLVGRTSQSTHDAVREEIDAENEEQAKP
jgi:adenylate cyclase